MQTIQDFLRFYSPSLAEREAPPEWPPDIFALSAVLLLESSAYLNTFREWPPSGSAAGGFLRVSPEAWAKRLHKIGRTWRKGWPASPPEISRWWKTLWSLRDLPVQEIGNVKQLYCALLHLCAASDEASYEVGVPRGKEAFENDPFRGWAEAGLAPGRRTGSTLCREIHPSKLRVLPKFHTPQTGMTLRSLSHHLALWAGSDVTPLWFTAGLPRLPDTGNGDDVHTLNLLLVPWPTSVSPKQFVPAHPACGRILNMPADRFGFFTYRREPDPERALRNMQAIYEAAEGLTDHIDGVVFPELALEASEYEAIRQWVTARKSFLIAGVGTAAAGDQPGRNRVGIEVPTTGTLQQVGTGHSVRPFQDKHHRWRLDRPQIVQYGLGGQLDPAKRWWEHTEAEARHLTFVSVLPWLSLCALVCEDLARQDPVAQLVRAVGPNLVIALLMDGPQLTSRWPARYATVLADDPGSSVLSFTSIGMCEFSRPPGKSLSRTVALWKDAYSGEAVQIDLPSGADAILLNLVRHVDEEWTADGRSDQGAAGYPALAGIHPVAAKTRASAAEA